VYAAGRLGLSVDDLRKARLVLNPSHFAPRGARANASRHITPSMLEKPSFEREVLCAVLEEPALIAEYAERIPPERFDNPRLRDVWQRMVAEARSLSQPSDVFSLFSEDDDARGVLLSVESVERLADSEARRAKLDRVIERFQRDDAQRQYLDVRKRMDSLMEAGQPVPADLRAEYADLALTLQKG
jgi:replicative DNA helicase